MEDCMRLCMRKLALWRTTTFKPLMTHAELEPIMVTMGFVGLPPYQETTGLGWKEYVCTAWWQPKPFSSLSSTAAEPPSPTDPRPRPKLPYPRIDGLHIDTYRAFLDAVNFYIQMWNISDIFHIRGLPLQRNYDRYRKWRCMEDESIFVYREGTLGGRNHLIVPNSVGKDSNSSCNDDSDGNDYGSVVIRDKGNNDRVNCVVPLKDIIVSIL
ncbi:hypothetical protein CXB51_035707 [Gossypium anomalum]|uniref:Uncharacterized protein n=1 Tax=Gossypium anomalum TaxID=47600 RepID=A0A8J6CKE1_9ROSI|nr:hypothetical protein CXB51_035707 [Gossypium anomalum]